MNNGSLGPKTLADRIKTIRKAMHLSQKDFAERTGISATLVSKLESGERNLTERIKNAICLSCGVGVPYLMEGEGEMFSNEPPVELINQLAIRYGLSDADKIFLITYLGLPDSSKKVFVDLLTSFINNYINYRL